MERYIILLTMKTPYSKYINFFEMACRGTVSYTMYMKGK